MGYLSLLFPLDSVINERVYIYIDARRKLVARRGACNESSDDGCYEARWESLFWRAPVIEAEEELRVKGN